MSVSSTARGAAEAVAPGVAGGAPLVSLTPPTLSPWAPPAGGGDDVKLVSPGWGEPSPVQAATRRRALRLKRFMVDVPPCNRLATPSNRNYSNRYQSSANRFSFLRRPR